MPELKYRIKRASEQKQSIYEYDSLPQGVLDEMRRLGTFVETDKNIKPHTCAFIDRVMWEGNFLYLCGIKRFTKRADLIASDMMNQPRERLKEELEYLRQLRDNYERNKHAEITSITNEYQDYISDAPSKAESLNAEMQKKINDVNQYVVELDNNIKEVQNELDSLSGSSHPEGENEHRVSGAKKIPTSRYGNYSDDGSEFEPAYFTGTHFICSYCRMDSGASEYTESGFSEKTISYPQCNCYTPRGGMSVTFYDGALKSSEVPGYWAEREMPNVYDKWKEGSTKDYPSAIPKRFPDKAEEQFAKRPKQLGFIYMVLNARAILAPCCWWVGDFPLIYKKEYFRAIDLAVAKSTAMLRFGIKAPDMSQYEGISSIADYVYRDGDYPFEGIGDNAGNSAVKRALLGRNYDWTLPDVGNNRRIIYALDSVITGDLKLEMNENDFESCSEPVFMWHFDSPAWFSPRNCGHMDCKVKYEWGHVCNGGGAFSLADGRACPYYESPLLGPEAESKKLCRLGRMYAGDYITGGALLELMWMSKGGLPWTEEEWESVWQVPHVWTTVPFSPVSVVTDKIRDRHGNLRKIDGSVNELRVYGQKTKIDLISGNVDGKSNTVLLPGGTVSAHKRSPSTGNLSKADRVPDFPTIVKELEARSISMLRIIWPHNDLVSLSEPAYERGENYLECLSKSKNTPYKKLVWDQDSACTDIIGQASEGSITNGIYCINTAFLTGEWATKRHDLETEMLELRVGQPKTQKLLKDLWKDLITSQMPEKTPILNSMPLLKINSQERGLFKFEKVPLNCLIRENFILVFGYSTEGVIDATFIKVQPIFKRAYAYQSEATLMTSWKTVWNGRPSLFMNMKELSQLNQEKKQEVVIRSEAIEIDDYNDPGISLYDLQRKIDALDREIEEAYAELSVLLYDMRLLEENKLKEKIENKKREIESKRDEITQKENERQEAQNALTLRTERNEEYEGDTRSTIRILEEEIDSLAEQIQDKQDEYNRKMSELASDGEDISKSSELKSLEEDISSLKDQKKSKETRLAELEAELDDDEQEDTEEADTTEEDEDTEYMELDYQQGDKDNQELLFSARGEDKVEKKDYSTFTKLYAPHMISDTDKWRDVATQYQRVDGHQEPPQENITLNVPDNSGKTEWRYMSINHSNYGEVKPKYTYPGNGAKSVVVYSTRQVDGAGERGVKLTSELGSWYPLSSCSSMIILVLNPEIFNNHTEAMIYSISAEATYKWKNQSGEDTEITKIINFAPFHYCQVPRAFPGYDEGKSAYKIGNTSKYGTDFVKVEVSEGINIIERPNTGRHPWIYFANAVTEETLVDKWHNYNGQWWPEIYDRQTAVLPEPSNVELYIEFAFIAEVYDYNDVNMSVWSDGTAYSTLSFGHPKAGIHRTIFYYEEEANENDSDSTCTVDSYSGIDGFDSVPIGSHSMATLWPHARLACRDYEIKYAWQDEMKNVQKSRPQRRGANNTCGGPAKRFTAYALGDHDLGTEFQQAVSYKERQDRFDSLSFEDRASFKLGNKDPIEGFPTEANKIFAAGDKRGACYYPYTRSEPYTVFLPQHKEYVWDFMLMWRNKYKAEEENSQPQLGKGRMLAADYCQIDNGPPLNRGAADWYRYWEYNPKGKPTKFVGKSLTRGPVFQLEYREYFDVDNKTVYLRPWVARSNYTRNAQWMVLLDKLIPTDAELDSKAVGWGEDYEPQEGEMTHEEWKERVKFNHRAWSVRKKFPAFYSRYGKGYYGQYESELNRLHDYGNRRGWDFTFPLDIDKIEFSYLPDDEDDEENCCNSNDTQCIKENPTWEVCSDCQQTQAEQQEIITLNKEIKDLTNQLRANNPPLIWDEKRAIEQSIYSKKARLAFLECEDQPKAPNDPDDVDFDTWSEVVSALYYYWQSSGKGYDDLMIEVDRGRSKGWSISIDPELEIGATTEEVDDAYQDCLDNRRALDERMESIKYEISRTQTAIEKIDENDVVSLAEHNRKLRALKTVYKSVRRDYLALECEEEESPETTGDEGGYETESYKVRAKTNMLTGCSKEDLVKRNIEQSGSFMILDNYVPGSPTSEKEIQKRANEKQGVFRKLQNSSQRYYQYEQKPFGYNYPWSPYDSPPLFGNTGREMFILELCTLGSVISWLPPEQESESTSSSGSLPDAKSDVDVEDDPYEEPDAPPDPPTSAGSSSSGDASTSTPSWWSGWSPTGRPQEMITLLAPPVECNRAIKPLSSEAYNPFYSYIITGGPFYEEMPDSESNVKPPSIRIVTEHNFSYYGEPYYRSDVGRFTLAPSSDSQITSVTVLGETTSYREPCYEHLAEEDDTDYTSSSSTTTTATQEEKQPCDEDHPDYPDCYETPCDDGSMPPCEEPCSDDDPDCDDKVEEALDEEAEDVDTIKGSDIKGLPFKDGELISVGEYYPGFCGPYNYSKFFVGYKKSIHGSVDIEGSEGADTSRYIHWAWPKDNKDLVTRGIGVVKWWVDTISGSGMTNTKDTYLGSVSDIYAGPYLRKLKDNDDGREVSCGPELTLSKGPNDEEIKPHPKEKESLYQKAYYAVVIESERMHNNALRKPLMWLHKIDNPDLTQIDDFKVPAYDKPIHVVQKDGSLVPGALGSGDENDVDENGKPSYRNAFSTGNITEDSGMLQDDYLPNLLSTKSKNDAGVYPGFVVPYVNYRLAGKVFTSKDYYDQKLGKIRLDRRQDYFGQDNHMIQAEIYIKQFEADAMFLEIDFNDFFVNDVDSYFRSAVDKMSIQVSVIGKPVEPIPGVDTISKKFVKRMPLDKNIDPKKDSSSPGTLTFDIDFSITRDLKIIFQLFVRTDINNFLYNKNCPWGVDRPQVRTVQIVENGSLVDKKVEDPLEEVYLDKIIDKLSIGMLSSGKCAEVVSVEETGFIVSYGKSCSITKDDGYKSEYNFFDEVNDDHYICQWEEAEKKINRNQGWWTDYVGGDKDSGVSLGRGLQGSSLEGTKPSDEAKYITGSMTDRNRKTDETFNKTVKAQAYADRCLEVPELPQSRLKIEAWRELNETGTHYADDVSITKWHYGGAWTTRLAGPEWMTSDLYTTRDMIWWPALPYYKGDVVMKGRYFKFDEQFKDEAKVMGKSRNPDPDDEFNEFANVYELRGFDSLLRIIQEWETMSSEERKTAYYKGNDYTKRPGVESRANNPMTDAIGRGASSDRSLAANTGLSSLGGGAGYGDGYHTGMSRSWQGSMANSAVQGILMSQPRNYTVFDRKEYVYIDEVGISPTLKSWASLQEKEVEQKNLYEKASNLSDELDTENGLVLKAIIPYHDWEELMRISGRDLNPDNVDTDLEPLSITDLQSVYGQFKVFWKIWDWDEVASFTFRGEESEDYKFPFGDKAGNDWSKVLSRECGQRWTHDESENVVQEDCSDVKTIGGADKCSDSNTKWSKTSLGWAEDREEGGLVESWPSTVSEDEGVTLLQPDPWWRY